jgi:hypothetical protein
MDQRCSRTLYTYTQTHTHTSSQGGSAMESTRHAFFYLFLTHTYIYICISQVGSALESLRRAGGGEEVNIPRSQLMRETVRS